MGEGVMGKFLRRIKPWQALVGYLCLYAAVSLSSLTHFPFVHSDESWLSGLTRHMLCSGSVGVTEPFFDLKPRYPHAIKTLFHLLQMLMLRLFGYHVGAFRLLSLLGALGALGVFYAILLRLTRRPWLAVAGTALLSLDVQFLYASHFARAEMLVLPGMLGCFLALGTGERRHPAWAAILTGLCIGLHPNSFVVAGLCGAVLALGQGFRDWKDVLRKLALYTGIVALFALAVIAVSLWMDGDFFRHYYGEYGADYQVHGSLLEKLGETGPYFQRLFEQVSGTYYTPDIRVQLLLFGAALLLGAVLLLMGRRRLRPTLCALFGIWLAMALMGRYGQPYVVFFFPFGYLLLAQLASLLGKRRGLALLTALGVFTGYMTFSQVQLVLEQPEQYDRYLSKIASVVPADAKTLGNLNAEYHFGDGKLLDYRNLPYLEREGLTLSQYLRSRQVRYILYSSELELLYDLRPRWDHIYGDLSFLPELQRLLRQECQLLYQFVDNQYGNRVVSYQHTGREFTVSVYRFVPVP